MKLQELFKTAQKELIGSVKTAQKEIKFCINRVVTTNKQLHGSNVIWDNEYNTAVVDYLKIIKVNQNQLKKQIKKSTKPFFTNYENMVFDPYENVAYLKCHCGYTNEVNVTKPQINECEDCKTVIVKYSLD